MKKLAPLAFLCAALIPTSAMALEEGLTRAVRVANLTAGELTPFLLQSVGGPTGQCLYVAVWENNDMTDSVECELYEQKVIGHTSCVGNAQGDIDSTLFSGSECQGFDQFGRVRDISYMILGENEDGDEVGSVLYEGIPAGPFSIRLI